MVFHRNAVAYAATILAYSMMHSVFYFYYVKLFLDKYHVGQMWFQISQVIYLLWNTFNDPLFGYFQDNSSWDVFKHRKKSILYGAPVYALCFLIPWFPWGTHEEGSWVVGLHLIVSLCAYDTMFTFVLLAECALFAEMSQQHEERLRLVKYSQIASVIGSTTVFLSSTFSNNMKDMFHLQMFCVGTAFIAWLCMRYTGLYADPEQTKENLIETPASSSNDLSFWAAWGITKQILSNRNFLSFGIMNFFQELHAAFCTSFLIIFADNLIPDEMMPAMLRSLLYGASFFIPQILVLASGRLISRVGYFNVFRTCFVTQCIAAICMYAVGRGHHWLLAMYFVFDLSLTYGASRLINLPLSDIVDEDQNIHKEVHPRSAMVFATNALVTKPSQSIAPMAVVAVLNLYDYQRLKDFATDHSKSESMTPDEYRDIENMQDAMFAILCGLPFLVCFTQFFIWNNFQLRNTHTTEAKHVEV